MWSCLPGPTNVGSEFLMQFTWRDRLQTRAPFTNQFPTASCFMIAYCSFRIIGPVIVAGGHSNIAFFVLVYIAYKQDEIHITS